MTSSCTAQELLGTRTGASSLMGGSCLTNFSLGVRWTSLLLNDSCDFFSLITRVTAFRQDALIAFTLARDRRNESNIFVAGFRAALTETDLSVTFLPSDVSRLSLEAIVIVNLTR